MRYELTDFEWAAIRPFLPNKPRGIPRVDDRRVLNGIFWVLRSGAPWRDLPETYGPRTTCYNRFVRWRQAGIWDRIMDALAAGHDAAVQMIDTSVVRVHQHGACIADNNFRCSTKSQSRPVVPACRPGLRRRVAALKRCISSSILSTFSSSCMIFDFLGALLLRSLSSALPTESLFISAIVTSSALRGTPDPASSAV